MVGKMTGQQAAVVVLGIVFLIGTDGRSARSLSNARLSRLRS